MSEIRRKYFLWGIVILVVVIFLVLAFRQPTIIDTISLPEVRINWETIRADDVARVSPEWGEPQLMPFNTDGWQEGDYISPDGNTFYFGYINVDAFRIQFGDGKLVKIGPSIDNKKTCLLGPTGSMNCGDSPRYDLFYVEKTANGWSAPQPHPLTLNCPVQSITLVNDHKAYFIASFDDQCSEKVIAYSEKKNGQWGSAIKIDEVSSTFWDDDPFVNQEENEMFFWSKRPAKFKGHNIFRSEKVNGKWQSPELLPEPINSEGDDMQTFVYENYLYFVSNRQPTGMPMGIYKSKRLGNNKFGEPELVVSSKLGVGEPSIPNDGSRLYFEQIFTDGKGNFKADMMYVNRKQ
ncbi:MAG: hypothetical protein V1704_00235 [Candidatus Vogelbacteria bacterium]